MSQKFNLIKRLGAGYFGEVWLAFDTGLNVERALKLIPPDKVPDRNNFFREAQILKAVEHPNIVRVEETDIFHDGRVYVAMEYMPKGSVANETQGGFISISRARIIMIGMLRGLQHAHSKKIIHRDIKPANILVGAAKAAKLSDFGLAIDPAVGLPKGNIANYDYVSHLAPELFRRTRGYSPLSDIYSCGVTFYRLLNGDSYLPVIPNTELRRSILRGNFPNRGMYREFIPTSFRRIINKAMNIDPTSRFQSADEMRHAIEQLEVHMN